MKTCKTLFYFLLLLFFNVPANAQFGNVWTFGYGFGVDFNAGFPVQLPTNAMNSIEGCASVCDSSGQLLFYTNGETIWDRNNNIMPNGDSIGGHQSSTQSALILPYPNHSKLYFVFTTNKNGNGGTEELDFSIVDLNLNNSLGEVTMKNQFLEDSVCEKLAATRHCNGQDWWIVVRKANSDYFVSYLLTSQGISNLPVLSLSSFPYISTGLFGSNAGRYGQMKISPNGKLIGCAYSNGGFEILNFDNLSGETGNVIFREFDPNLMAYGLSFSTDSKDIFAGYRYFQAPPLPYLNKLVRYSLDTLNSNAIDNSRSFFEINDSTTFYSDIITQFGSFQIGNDGFIYGLGTALDTLTGGGRCLLFRIIEGNSPSIFRFTFYFPPSTGTGQGLPNTYDGIYTNHHKASLRLPLCNGPFPFDSIPFFDSLLTVTRDYSWDFGDPSSGTNNYSNLQHPIHQYSATGTYTVNLTLESDCNPIVVTQQVLVTQVPPSIPLVSLNMGHLESTPSDNYQWFFEGAPITGAVFQQYFPTQTGNYTVQVSNPSGCTATSLPFNVTTVQLKELEAFPKFSMVQNENLITLQCNPLTDCFYCLELIDLQGRVLQTYAYQQKQINVNINISELQSGIYLLRVNGREVRKVQRD
jgi:hypothetical protein